MGDNKRTVYVGGLADEVTEQLVSDAFIPFGDIVEIQMPVDYESQKHRGFAFVEFETAEDAAAAIDNMVKIQRKCLIFANPANHFCGIQKILTNLKKSFIALFDPNPLFIRNCN